MAEDIRERIKLVRNTLNISQRNFAKHIYISQALLGEIELGNRNINKRIIQLISTEFRVNKNWLLTGDGEMFDAPPPDPQLEKLIGIFNQLDKKLKDYLLDQSMGLLEIQKEKIEKSTTSP